jgi:hypothetical protein
MGDRRRVKGVKPIRNVTRKLSKLEPVEAKLKKVDDEEQEPRAMLIAQDVMKHFPDLVSKNDPEDDGESELPEGKGRKGGGLVIARADGWIPYLVAAIIELDERLKALEPPQPPKA